MIEQKEEIEKSSLVGDFNNYFSKFDRATLQKISKDIERLKLLSTNIFKLTLRDQPTQEQNTCSFQVPMEHVYR